LHAAAHVAESGRRVLNVHHPSTNRVSRPSVAARQGRDVRATRTILERVEVETVNVVIAIGRVAPGRDPLRLAFLQFATCALLSLPAALALEPGTWGGLLLIVPALLYAGVLSIGLGYTTQVIAQRHTAPTHAAIILSTESVFAALAGWLVLRESLSREQLFGCGLMLTGILLAQVPRSVSEPV
jgi:drug/metabolite transporter (DMT)-like permease